MSDVMLRFSPDVIMAGAYVTLGPLLAALVMAIRAVRFGGRIRLIALAGIGCALVLALLIAAPVLPIDPDGHRPLMAALLTGVALAWLATAALARRGLWMDGAVIVLPALTGVALIVAEHG